MSTDPHRPPASAWRLPTGLGCCVAATLFAVSSPAQAEEAQWFVQTGGLSHHFQQTKAAGRQWQETHPGLGVERRTLGDDGWSWRSTLGAMQDSRGFWGGYGGAAYVRSWQWGPAVETSLGLGAYAFYRSSTWKGDMALVPALLPTASITLPKAQFALNVVYVPQIGSSEKTMPSVLHAQLSWRFR